MSIFKSDRCSVCKTHRGNRFCLRTGKKICWHCCNEKRVDYKCSENCKYSLKQIKEGLFELKTNADSKAEYDDLLRNEIKLWVRKPQDLFEGRLPLKMSETEEGRKQLYDFFNKIPHEKRQPLTYLKSTLNLAELEVYGEAEGPETNSKKFLDKIIEQDWKTTTEFLLHSQNYAKSDEYMQNYEKRMMSDKIIRRVTEYDLISSAMNKERDKALVFFEVTGRHNLTISLKQINKQWKILNKVYAEPAAVSGENEANKQVAVLLSKNETGDAYELLKKFSVIYPDSGDLHYYWGLYHSMNNKSSKAEASFLDAIEIDPEFAEAKYNYAFLMHTQNKTDRAKELYYEIIAIDENEPKTLNNLASILIDEGKNEEAKELLERCLKEVPDFEIAKQNLERIE